MLDVRLKIFKANQRCRVCARSTSSISHHTSHIPAGISLIEVLISMFVLLFGLMGVAAIFPVGNHYVVEGEKFDLASGIAQNAFEEMVSRGMLRPEVWLYASNPIGNESFDPRGVVPLPHPGTHPLVIQDSNGPTAGSFNGTDARILAGRAFVIDPMGAAADFADGVANSVFYPFGSLIGTNNNKEALNTLMPPIWHTDQRGPFSENFWPVRRITLPVPDTTGTTAYAAMNTPVAETIFRLRDDLAVEQPDESDRPSIQRWDIDTTSNTLLRRQYKGDYSWLATIVPTTNRGLEALQPSSADYGEINCDVSVVVFRKRDETPSAESERLIEAELLQGGELVIYSSSNDNVEAKEAVDAAVEDLRPGNWISLMGVNQTTGDFVMKWYRLLSLDDETDELILNRASSDGGDVTVQGRRAMILGPNWPATPNPATAGQFLPYITNLRAGIMPGAISVVTKPMKMENTSLWKTN